MTRKRFHGLKKVKVRATWNKYNLYNLSRIRDRLDSSSGTYYQQKWGAKSISRAYHGEHVRERQWERMFRPRMAAVVPMDHKYLADHDGSELAAGRGSGLDEPWKAGAGVADKFGKGTIPYMHMTYAPLERRLDMAVWRALFASSARQARQFCIHGKVRVNGQKMPYAGYLLNPGDMFQVEPDSVLFATGAKKDNAQASEARHERKQKRSVWRRLGRLKMKSPRVLNMKEPSSESEKGKPLAGLVKAEPSSEPKSEAVKAAPPMRSARTLDMIREERKASLEKLLFDAQEQYNMGKQYLGAKRKQGIRALIKQIKHVRATINRKSEAELDQELKELVEKALEARRLSKVEGAVPKKKPDEEKVEKITERYLRVRQPKEENPVDVEKPYATPWKPRPYMSPFAFIPRYLEVNQKICSAVYLRHPVARPGLAEVPTPFGKETLQLAFNWYLRRR